MPLWVARRARVWKARRVPEEPVTFDELEQLLLRLTGNSVEAMEQQMQTRLKEQTLVGGKRVTRQELPELPQDAVQAYCANSAVPSPQITSSLMLVPPMVHQRARSRARSGPR